MATPSAGRKSKSSFAKPKKNESRSLKRKRGIEDLDQLRRKVEELDLKAGITDFSDLPLSQPTIAGLDASHFKTPTEIQSKGLPLALKGKDILGAAKTGSGKTLSFIIPVLENLYRQEWTEYDGLGALIISPTRELAIQIFDVLRKVGRSHNFSAGLVVGGKDVKEEAERITRMSILVGTPGRLLQHMDQTPGFELNNLQLLVLDEADRCMDMGFQRDVDAIIQHLPQQRQTMLFSATQTKKVSDLARLSLRDPEYVAVHEAATSATPTALQQYYVVTPLHEKLNTLFSFIKGSLKAKIIVFFSSGKQVRFVYESFRRLQPGIPLLHLHGRQKQAARLDITSKFSKSKNSCLLTTDVVARGLDFPAVDWVIQVDCPEDADTYIHRVGRTARYERAGKAVLFLDPSETQGMLKRLEHKKVPIQQTKPREKKHQPITSQLQNLCFQDPELKYTGQKAFTSYAKSIFVQKDKEVFNIKSYDMDQFASSMGLPGAPKIKFQKGDDARKLKNAPRAAPSDDEISDTEEGSKKPKGEVRTKYDRMFERRNQDILSGHYSKMIAEDDAGNKDNGDADEDNDFLFVKRVLPVADDIASSSEKEEEDDDDDNEVAAGGPAPKIIPGIGKEPIVIDSKRREKLLKSKKKLTKLKEKGTKLVFDEDGQAHQMYELEDEDDFAKRGTAEAQRAKFLEEEAARVREADLDDKQLVKEKKREKREKKKAREAAEKVDEDDGAPELVDAGDDQDPMALLASLPMAGDEDEEERPSKRPKKWFEDDSDDEKTVARRKGRIVEVDDEPETLEDLEALAAGLLQ